ncbi:MAG: 4Fe-4S binding protein [Spirochaetales bacterium]|nr:4Fe-4S binding protein [Spirochaetales bacterium]
MKTNSAFKAPNWILFSLMCFVVLLFVLFTNNFSGYALVYSAFLLFIYGRLTFGKRESRPKYRTIFMVTYAVLFCVSFIFDLYQERGSMAITDGAFTNAELPFCHIAIPQVLIPFIITGRIIFPARILNHYAALASMVLIWLTLAISIGRGWCSWVCFYGGWEEGSSSISKKRKINLLPKNKELRDFHMGFMVFIVLGSLSAMASIYCDWFCPFKLVTEYTPMNTIPALIAGVIFIGLFLGFVVILPILTKRRTQCSTICPFGAFAALTDKVSLFSVRINTEKCIGCMKCAKTCKFGAIDIKTIQDKKGQVEFNCAKCGDCVSICPENAIYYDFKFIRKCARSEKKSGRIAKVIKEVCSPENMFRFAAFSFAVIMSAGSSIGAMKVIAGLFIK